MQPKYKVHIVKANNVFEINISKLTRLSLFYGGELVGAFGTEVSTLKEHLFAHRSPRRARMVAVVQRRLEGRIQYPEMSQLDALIIDHAAARHRYTGPGLAFCSHAIPKPNPAVLFWRKLLRELSSVTELGQNSRIQGLKL